MENGTDQMGVTQVIKVGLPESSGSTKRLEYMGSTPSKASRTGKEVIERMKNEDPPKIRTVRGKLNFRR